MRLQHKPISPPYNNHEKDELLGWKTIENYSFCKEGVSDKQGNLFNLNLNFTNHGFRKWNDCNVDSATAIVFFLGDSYTESVETSDDNLFYKNLRDSLKLKIYAYGAAGYGTIQEYLFLKKYIDSIKPNMVVLEMCNNDFVDNYWEVEKRNCYHAGQVRPYLNFDNTLEYHHPLRWWKQVHDYSLFTGFILERVHNSFIKFGWCKKEELTVEEMIADDGFLKDLINESFNRTEHALAQIKKLTDSHNSRLIVFNADAYSTGVNWLPKTCEKLNITFAPGIGELLAMKEANGESVRAWDGYHWNANGHKIVSDTLLCFIRTH